MGLHNSFAPIFIDMSCEKPVLPFSFHGHIITKKEKQQFFLHSTQLLQNP